MKITVIFGHTTYKQCAQWPKAYSRSSRHKTQWCTV